MQEEKEKHTIHHIIEKRINVSKITLQKEEMSKKIFTFTLNIEFNIVSFR